MIWPWEWNEAKKARKFIEMAREQGFDDETTLEEIYAGKTPHQVLVDRGVRLMTVNEIVSILKKHSLKGDIIIKDEETGQEFIYDSYGNYKEKPSNPTKEDL